MGTRLLLLLLPVVVVMLHGCHGDPDTTTNSEMKTIMQGMSNEMNAMTMTGDVDRDFASMMKLHHQGAITMANKLLEKGSSAELKKMARQMIDKQTAEIARLDTFLLNNNVRISDKGAALDADMKEALDRMDRNAESQSLKGNIDSDFATLMIMHHASALEMANAFLKYSDQPGLREMASVMIVDQSEEIDALRNWLVNNRQF
ncbi:MAG TPA: DUF305 domain-containing protein [Ohtaekwangia sp.]|uniref:DUF305 domain-containing protein n=1 Tax=Ohtaekwangia sp. TaxID=2066019 RepID=UPI002F9350FE